MECIGPSLASLAIDTEVIISWVKAESKHWRSVIGRQIKPGYDSWLTADQASTDRTATNIDSFNESGSGGQTLE